MVWSSPLNKTVGKFVVDEVPQKSLSGVVLSTIVVEAAGCTHAHGGPLSQLHHDDGCLDGRSRSTTPTGWPDWLPLLSIHSVGVVVSTLVCLLLCLRMQHKAR